ncbi:MAG: CHAT domain-containing protein [Candidatus Rhabdochlamydia sp.]
MESTVRLLTTAGMVKIPFNVSKGLDKIRLYYFFDQQPEDIRKIQTLFELEMKGNVYQGKIFQIFERIQTRPYLLKEGKTFRLISADNVFELQEKYLKNNQGIINFYKEILKIFLKMKDHENEQWVYFKLGNSYSTLGDYRGSIMYHEKALKIALELKDLLAERSAYGNLGNDYQGLGNYKEAITYHEKHLKIALELKDRVGEGNAYCNLGNGYHSLGDYGGAITYHEKHLKIALKLKDLVGEGSAYGNLGNDYQGLGNYKEAITYHEKHLKIALKMKDLVGEGSAYGNLGNGYEEIGDCRRAITYHEKHLKIALELNDVVSEGSACSNLGNSYYGLGDYREAITYHEKHLKIALELNDVVREKNAYCNLGNAYHGLGDCRRAITYHEKHLKIALKLKDKVSEGKAYSNLGNSYYELGDYERAITYYEKYLKLVLELKDRVGEGSAYGNLGIAYNELGDCRGAIAYHEKHLKIALKLKDRVGERKVYGNLGHTYLKQGDGNKAEEYFQQDIKISAVLHHQLKEPKWQISFFEEHSFSYRGLERALLQQKKLYEALEATDMKRARALSSLISRNPSLPFYQQGPIASINIQKIKDLAKKFHTTFVIYSLLTIKFENCSLQAWIISSTSESIPSISLPIPDDMLLNFDQIFKQFPYSIAIKRPHRGDKDMRENERQPGDVFKDNLSSWYSCLIAPLEAYFPAKNSGETLTFIPEGFLAHLPFGAFYNQKEDKYLIENYLISVAPSIQVLSLLDELPKERCHEVLLMGNPTASQKEDKPLPYTEPEVRDIIAPMMDHFKVHVLTQDEATPASVIAHAPSARFIHIACHGVANQKTVEKTHPDSVFEGLFKLASDDQHPLGHLHAEEIVSMSLKADLVFMSACHLGRGNLKQEGSIGPVWSFLGAGAKSTIASYWPLPDGEATVKMVKTFYKYYLGIETAKLSKAKALQQAVLEVMKTERDKPRQWGAFFLSGLIE